MKKCKIEVLKTTFHEDLAKQYGCKNLGKCPMHKVGDIFYGAEKLYQHHEFGSGIPVSVNGHITTKSALGSENSIDMAKFCSKFGGPISGLCFGIIIFLNFWTFLVFGIVGGLIVGLILVIFLIILNYVLERNARLIYGKYGE